jgi:hypothetical protein
MFILLRGHHLCRPHQPVPLNALVRTRCDHSGFGPQTRRDSLEALTPCFPISKKMTVQVET